MGIGLGVDEQALLGEPLGEPASGESLKTQTREIASGLRCPVCQGLSVADSPSPSAMAMLSQVRDLVEQGYTRKQISDYFESTYGEFVRLSPRVEGFNLVVWVAPILVVLAGVAVLAVRYRNSGAATRAGPTDAEELDPYLAKVRADLASALPVEEAAQE